MSPLRTIYQIGYILSIFDKLLVGGGIAFAGLITKGIFGDIKETRRRKSSPLHFDDVLTYTDFVEIVEELAQQTVRVKGSLVTGMTIKLTIKSNSGLSSWNAEIDFNDYGYLTGSYWITSENQDSIVPNHFASLVQKEVLRRIQ